MSLAAWPAAMLACAIIGLLVVQPKVAAGRASATGAGSLIAAEDEIQVYLRKAQSLIAAKDFGPAIDLLQNLIIHAGGSLAQAPDGSRYVSVSLLANELLGQMGAEGLKQYRSLYDEQAQSLFERAQAQGDQAGLRLVSRRYLHTSCGPAALEALGTLYMDTGRFVQAAAAMSEACKALEAAGRSQPLLMAKAAACHYWSGDRAAGDAIAQRLAQEHAQAFAEVGPPDDRRQVKLTEWLEAARLSPVAGQDATQAQGLFGGIGASPSGGGVMPQPAEGLMPRWRSHPSGKAVSSSITDSIGTYMMYNYGYMPALPAAAASIRDGHVEFRVSVGPSGAKLRMPPLLYPVVAQSDDRELVIYRDDADIVAMDLATGQVVWSTSRGSAGSGRALERPVPSAAAAMGNYGYYGGLSSLGDMGRYWLTVGQGRVYATWGYMFRHNDGNTLMAMRQNPQLAKLMSDTSALVALDARTGKVLWDVGNGKGDTPLVRACKFVSPPTYHDGFLYVVATHVENYHLVCLSASTGATLWSAVVSQEPLNSSYIPAPARSSPPAISDGRVIVLTNAGVVACFESATGAPLWAHQYVASPGQPPLAASYSLGHVQVGEMFPVNPVLCMRGLVVCLPADANELLVLDAAGGRMLRQTSRGAGRDLSYIDDARVLLSGQGLAVVAPQTGASLFTASDLRITGRPVVTPRSVIASDSGRLLRLDLGDYSLTSSPQTSGLLGNLISTGESIIAANTYGLCVYGDYTGGLALLSRRVEAANTGETLRAALLARGMFAMNCRQYAGAAGDFARYRELAAEAQDSGAAERIDAWLYRSLVAAANSAEDPGRMCELFEQAVGHARTDQERAHLLLRQAKANLLRGDCVQALAAAQSLLERYPSEQMVDYPVGPEASAVCDGPDVPRTSGRSLAISMIRAVRTKGADGAAACRAMDNEAKAALDAARSARDPQAMAAVASRWPAAAWAHGALFAAAETCYVQARGLSGTGKSAAIARAMQWLAACEGSEDSSIRLSAGAALAKLQVEYGSRALATLVAQPLRASDPSQEVIFADMHGRLGDVLDRMGLSAMPRRAPEELSLPFAGSWTLSGSSAMLVRDQNNRVVHVGSRAVVLLDGSYVLLDVLARDAEAAVLGRVPAGVGENFQANPFAMAAQVMLGGVGAGGKTVCVAGRHGVVGFDSAPGMKELYRLKFDAVSGITAPQMMASGEGVMILAGAGDVTCIDIDSGQVRWRSRLVGPAKHLSAPPLVENGVVCLLQADHRTITCLDLRNGKALWRRTDGAQRALFAGAGVLVLQGGKYISAWELGAGKMPQRPLWARELASNEQASLMAASGDRAVLWRHREGSTSRAGAEMANQPMVFWGPRGRFMAMPQALALPAVDFSESVSSLDVLSISAGGASVASAPLRSGGSAAMPLYAAIEGDELYVVMSTWPQARPVLYGANTAGNVLLARYSASTGQRVWLSEALASAGVNSGRAIMPPQMARSHVLLDVGHYVARGQSTSTFVAARSSGAAQTLNIYDDAAVRNFGTAEPLAGRLLSAGGGSIRVLCNDSSVQPATRPTTLPAATRPADDGGPTEPQSPPEIEEVPVGEDPADGEEHNPVFDDGQILIIPEEVQLELQQEAVEQ
jgi:outer membrane protein assembly factor BamB/tetratricopeptide (TPR) repeat protein